MIADRNRFCDRKKLPLSRLCVERSFEDTFTAWHGSHADRPECRFTTPVRATPLPPRHSLPVHQGEAVPPSPAQQLQLRTSVCYMWYPDKYDSPLHLLHAVVAPGHIATAR